MILSDLATSAAKVMFNLNCLFTLKLRISAVCLNLSSTLHLFVYILDINNGGDGQPPNKRVRMSHGGSGGSGGGSGGSSVSGNYGHHNHMGQGQMYSTGSSMTNFNQQRYN